MSEHIIITREAITREARSVIGVPFRHQHSDPQTGGLDCRGLLEWVAHRTTGRALPPVHNYDRKPSGREFYERLKAEMIEIDKGEARAGDVVLIRFPRDTEARHAGILVEGLYETMIVHAFESDRPGHVIEEPYRGWPKRCTVAAFRFPGVRD